MILESLERFRKNEVTRALLFLESRDAEIGSGIALRNGHDAMVFNEAVEVSIVAWLLPQSVNFGLARASDHVSKARRFGFEQFHLSGRRTGKKKSARELRQR